MSHPIIKYVVDGLLKKKDGDTQEIMSTFLRDNETEVLDTQEYYKHQHDGGGDSGGTPTATLTSVVSPVTLSEGQVTVEAHGTGLTTLENLVLIDSSDANNSQVLAPTTGNDTIRSFQSDNTVTAGTYDVTGRNETDDWVTNTLSGALVVEAAETGGPPTLVSCSPGTGSLTVPTSVTITGTNLPELSGEGSATPSWEDGEGGITSSLDDAVRVSSHTYTGTIPAASVFSLAGHTLNIILVDNLSGDVLVRLTGVFTYPA